MEMLRFGRRNLEKKKEGEKISFLFYYQQQYLYFKKN